MAAPPPPNSCVRALSRLKLASMDSLSHAQDIMNSRSHHTRSLHLPEVTLTWKESHHQAHRHFYTSILQGTPFKKPLRRYQIDVQAAKRLANSKTCPPTNLLVCGWHGHCASTGCMTTCVRATPQPNIEVVQFSTWNSHPKPENETCPKNSTSQTCFPRACADAAMNPVTSDGTHKP